MAKRASIFAKPASEPKDAEIAEAPAEKRPDQAGKRLIGAQFPEAVAALNLKLWDEDQNRLVPFPKTKSGVNRMADAS